VNDAPVVTMTASALAFTEGNGATAVDAGLTVTDADSTNLASATVAITANFVTGEDVLGLHDAERDHGSFNATTGRADAVGLGDGRELPGGAAVGDLRQRSTNPSTAARTVSVVANDGTANSNTATRAITVAR
jgi:hypothetical protein